MSNYLPTLYQQFIHKSRYARWLWDKNRRETWEETVGRYFDFFEEHLNDVCNYKINSEERKKLETAVLNLSVMPSMRCLMTAGEALKRENIAGFNCSYLVINRVQAFDEMLYILMCGTGVGFSVESREVEKLPPVAENFHISDTIITVADSKLGWARAFKEVIGMLYIGQIPKWDISKVRAAGMPLKVFGGRASGPEPLVSLFNFCVEIFKKAAGRKLTSLECHDICCKIADIVVVGGVRRSALISLSDLSDDRMRHAKSGQWWIADPQRALANNSAVYNSKPDVGIFMDEWKALYDSKSGERGIFNRLAGKKHIEKNGRRNADYDMGVNPCGEILLRDRGLCNLSEVIVRSTDNEKTITEKIQLATILGTWQSTLTNYKYVSRKWKENSEEERLLGVSLTGIMDCDYTNGRKEELPLRLRKWKECAIETNKEWAQKLKINSSVAITCGKPSGTVSQLVDSASGIHARHGPYYIRTVRADKKDPLAILMRDVGFPCEDDITKPDNTFIFSFPIKSPENAIFRKDIGAIQQLELWLQYRENFSEHNPSVTITIKENEWFEVAAWVYKNFDNMTGVSFLPYSEHSYKQAPYQDCTKEEYENLLMKMPNDIDWTLLEKYEKSDQTEGAQELACSAAGGCEI
jgi:ribonucleoside-diphosphate reductase alpha chain